MYVAASTGWNTSISSVYFSNSYVKSSCLAKEKFQPFNFELNTFLKLWGWEAKTVFLICSFSVRWKDERNSTLRYFGIFNAAATKSMKEINQNLFLLRTSSPSSILCVLAFFYWEETQQLLLWSVLRITVTMLGITTPFLLNLQRK